VVSEGFLKQMRIKGWPNHSVNLIPCLICSSIVYISFSSFHKIREQSIKDYKKEMKAFLANGI
jgi:hypothetical protein